MSMIINSDKFHKIIIRMLQGAKGEDGKDGISGDYDGLINKPSINGVQLDGNVTGDALNLVSKDAIAQALYPSGSIYLSTVNVDPANLFGGVWQRIKDVFLLTAGDKYTAGSTGGSADAVVVEHQHSESASAIRTSTKSSYRVLLKSNATASDASVALADNDPNVFDYSLKTLSEGVSGTGKNMPPYLTVYAWKRVDGLRSEYTEDLNITITAGSIVAREHVLTYTPVTGTNIIVSYGSNQTIQFTAGTASSTSVNGVMVAYDGAKSISISASGSSTADTTFTSVTYTSDIPSVVPDPTPVPTEEITETVEIGMVADDSTQKTYTLSDSPVTNTEISLAIQIGGTGVTSAVFTAGRASTKTVTSYLTITYDGSRTFTFTPNSSHPLIVVRTATYSIESGE